MKLIVAIVPDHAAGKAERSLVAAGFTSTRLATTGDILEAGNTTLLIGVPGTRVDRVLRLLREWAPGEGEAFVLATQAAEAGVIQAFAGVGAGRPV
ncbi:MAG TPA: cyclic-di-AMP receptor [Symbiobacteriaceae bacterium]|nr:cyclic-di-AMP receptor [Symbiobacteriaceae bacterium]